MKACVKRLSKSRLSEIFGFDTTVRKSIQNSVQIFTHLTVKNGQVSSQIYLQST